MAHGKSIELSNIPKPEPIKIARHVVPDTLGKDNKMHPTPANRAERRAAGRPGGPFGWMVKSSTAPYVKPAEEVD